MSAQAEGGSGFAKGAPISSIRPDGKRVAIYPSDVRGRFITRRRLLWVGLIAFYVALPLVPVGGHPAVHLDVAARKFFLFGATFNAQDFWIVVFLLTTVGSVLFFATAWLGRVWCGWACPQTVFLEGVYRPIERWIEGPRERRIRASQGGWTLSRILRSGAKHAAFLAVSYVLAHVALGLFVSVQSLVAMIVEGPANHLTAFGWALAMTGVLYFNFAWFREQLCVVVCPYGRLQSAMQDRDSLIIGYDVARGEPRGKVQKKAAAPEFDLSTVPLVVLAAKAASAPGDCVDCTRCVTVCPVGIDIRNGLQMECIACAQCVDACDEVMTKVGRPEGLIRYDSLNGLAGEQKRVLRPRLFAYGTVMAATSIALVLALMLRTPFEANLMRFRGAPYVLDGADVRNQFELHLVNKSPSERQFMLSADAAGARIVLPQKDVRLGSLESFRVPVFVTATRDALKSAPELVLTVREVDGAEKVVRARLIGPAAR